MTTTHAPHIPSANGHLLPAQRTAALALDDGASPAETAQSTGLEPTDLAVAEHLTAQESVAISRLLDRADRSSDPKTRELANRARDLIAQIKDRIQNEAAAAAAQRKVDQLREELAKAEQELAAATGKTSVHKPKAKAAKNNETAQIRRWARENGYDVADLGRIPADIEAAYRARGQA